MTFVQVLSSEFRMQSARYLQDLKSECKCVLRTGTRVNTAQNLPDNTSEPLSKLLVSPLIFPIVVPYIIPLKEFRLQLK